MQLRQTVNTDSKSKNAVEHFKKCPACGDTCLIEVKPEVLCSKCDWNSIIWSVSRGSMDNIFAASIEQLKYDRQNRYEKVKAPKRPLSSLTGALLESDFSDAS
jgi:hypothetical protein